MRIQPGKGTDRVVLGQRRDDVEASLGEPDSVQGSRAFYHQSSPALVVDYDDAGVVELIELAVADRPEHQVTLDGVQLTGRALDEVRADLEALGHSGRESDIGLDYPAGFAARPARARPLGA